MKNTSPAIKLKRTNKYNTYQFYGVMANRDISLNDGLKIACLTTYKWLRERLDNINVPEEILNYSPLDYKKVKNEEFKSFYLNDVFTIVCGTGYKSSILFILPNFLIVKR